MGIIKFPALGEEISNITIKDKGKKMNFILNLTQHKATKEQKEEGVIDLPNEYHEKVKQLLTFDDIPQDIDMKIKAYQITKVLLNVISDMYDMDFDNDIHRLIRILSVTKIDALIGGAPYFMRYIEDALKEVHITPVYSFSKRVSEEHEDENGNIIKKNVFKHIGFIRK